MPQFRDVLVGLSIVSAAEALAVHLIVPEYMSAHNFSRSIGRLVLVNIFVYMFFGHFIYPLLLSPLRGLPQPKGSFIYGHGFATFSKPLGAEFLGWVKNIPNGGAIRFRGFFNDDRLLLTSPEALKAVLSDYSYDYEKPYPVRHFLIKILGRGLLMAEGSEHKFQRRHLMPAFQVKQIRDLYPIFWEKARGMVEQIEAQIADQADNVVELNDWATRVTLDIIGAAGLGKDFGSLRNPNDELVQKYNQLLEPTGEKGAYFALNIVLPEWMVRCIPWKIHKQLDDLTSELKQYAMDLVREREARVKRKDDGDEKDILTLLVQSGDFKQSELADQLLTFIAAGHETTSSTLTWVGYLLAVNPDVQSRLREEVRTNLPSLLQIPGPSFAEIDNLPYLNAVCNETIRLYPSVPSTIRQAMRPSFIPLKTEAGIVYRPIPKGTIIQLVPWAINRSPDIWGPDAEQFVPERWMGEGKGNTGGQSSNYSQITFLHGPRSCIGQGFARAELRCLVAALVGRFDLQLADPNKKAVPAGVITTKPADGMHLKMKTVEGW